MSEGWYAGPGAVQAHRQKEMTIWEPLPQPYDNTSTYASHYQKWPVQMRQKAKAPQGQRPLSAQKFDTRSTMQDAYQHHRAIVQPKSCRPQSATPASSNPIGLHLPLQAGKLGPQSYPEKASDGTQLVARM